ncbi:fatty acyl-AMP ligase [Streptomyces sp. HPF1205]|uniref:fatty acyl-AMP ligase n=1 Tax=Streptomyces sp. HPF1205 TaxID=2873262 RepID=UPI001CEC90DB|nr:fatty acyl-AMP ligase [Streptomyces sp. HPF1205]
MSYSGTFTDLVRARCAEFADDEVHLQLRETPEGTAADRLTYGELDRAARRVARALRAHGVEGRPVLLAFPGSLEFLKAFAGCLYAGAVAVPAPLPEGNARGRLGRATGILRDSGARVVLTDRAGAPDVARWLATEGFDDVLCVATDALRENDSSDDAGGGEPFRPPATRPEDPALLQYTSGSVTEPRGVMVSHRNLTANHAALQRVLGTTAADRFGGWLPLHHDMGLAHLLHPLWLGSASVLLAPAAFLHRPLRWLEAVERYRVTVGGGPDFCYDLALRRVTDREVRGLDLSRWRLALNGAEPVRAETLDAFARRFAAAGLRPEALYPCYGLAEATLVVSGGAAGHPYRRRAVDADALARDVLAPAEPGRESTVLVSSGRPVGVDLRVVDPATGREVPEGTVGEIWLRGESVAAGYHGKPAETKAAFRAVLEGGEGGFLRTGDLGALEDGQLYVTGRLKELVIVAGRNIYPQDVEHAARAAHPALAGRPGAAFSVPAGRERLVLVQEVRAGQSGPDGLGELAELIRRAIREEFGVPAANVLLVRSGTVRRTTSGKVRRTFMRAEFLAGRVYGEYEALDPDVRALQRPGDALLGRDLLDSAAPGGVS